MTLKIKVCGMRNPNNIAELIKLSPDFIGFIFQPQSKRFIGTTIPYEIQRLIPTSIQKVGVFVDEPFDTLIEKFRVSNLHMVQLHGNEGPEFCEQLKNLNIPVIKVFSITAEFDFESTFPFESCCDYYLFDTAGALKGGNGLKFDWNKLNEYHGNKLFFLSGGIHYSDIEAITRIDHQRIYGVDVNSGFETGPGMKDILQLESFIHDLRNYKI